MKQTIKLTSKQTKEGHRSILIIYLEVYLFRKDFSSIKIKCFQVKKILYKIIPNTQF